MTELQLQDFIDSYEWIFAKTYAKTAPHEYCVCEYGDPKRNEFVEFAKHIKQHGYKDYFWGHPNMYLRIGEWKYWSMDDPVENTNLINRALLNVSEKGR